jgi:DNA-binding response OmpR family regulator
MNVLLVEDDERIIEFVLRGLHAEGYHVDVARNGPDALRRALAPACQLIILDLLLPDLDGREVCRQLRAANVATPILMLTALDTLDDRVRGLRMGADDYLAKPFAFEELVARVQAWPGAAPSIAASPPSSKCTTSCSTAPPAKSGAASG